MQNIKQIIPVDFVAGTHGHFLAFLLNKFFGYIPDMTDPFTALGTSHKIDQEYLKNRAFDARHWFQNYRQQIKYYPKIINIKFDIDDLLLVSSISLLRAGDLQISNDCLEHNTVSKLNNKFYREVLEKIYQSYPFLNRACPDIPRNVLREFYKFGFSNPEKNGYWIELQKMTYEHDPDVFTIKLKDFYDRALLSQKLKDIQCWYGRPLTMTDEFDHLHKKFLEKIEFLDHKKICDDLIDLIIKGRHLKIPTLTLFQESYINSQLEKIFKKEMPFHDVEYFTSTKDLLYYIKNLAPQL